MAYYGVVFPEFWTGRTGRELRARGKDAQILGLYLITNRHTNMIGLYRLLPDDIRHETGLGLKAIETGLRAVHETDFGIFDAESSYVWVKTMARFRMALQPGQALEPEDKKVAGLNRIYHAIDPNPFLGEFFDANHKILRIKKRRDSVGVVVAFAVTTTGRAYLAPSKPLVSQVTESGIRDQDQDQKKAPPLPRRLRETLPGKNPGAVRELIAALVLKAAPEETFADLKVLAKQACADHGLLYDAELVGSALEQALARKVKAS